MKTLLTFFLLCSITILCKAQKISAEQLLGRWDMQTIVIYDTNRVDVNDINGIYIKLLQNASIKGNLTQEDSLHILETCKKQIEEMRMIYMDFHENFFVTNKFFSGHRPSNIADTIDYELTENATIITKENGINMEYTISIKGDIITLIPTNKKIGLSKLVLKRDTQQKSRD